MRFRQVMAVLVIALLPGAGRSESAEESSLVWRSGPVVDADIHGWPIRTMLGQIAALTGWKVYVEPDLEQTVSVAFKNLSEGQALKMLLRHVNYALVREPSAGGGRATSASLYVYQNSVGGATSLVTPDLTEKPPNWLANEIIVTLPPGSMEDIEKLAAQLGGKIVASSEGLNSYRLEFEDAEAARKAREKLAARDDLQVSDNFELQRPGFTGDGVFNAASFGIDPAPVGASEQVVVALLDTAVQPLDGKMNDFLLPSIRIAGEPGQLPETPTHGTSMALAIAQHPNIRILPIDIYGASETTTTFEVAEGLLKAIRANPRFINESFGGPGYNPLIEQLHAIAREKEIIVTVSGGNQKAEVPILPAADPNVFAVTAADASGNVVSWANDAPYIDLKAPAGAIIQFNGKRYQSVGTSTSAALTSGRGARLAAQGLTQAEVAAELWNSQNLKAIPNPD